MRGFFRWSSKWWPGVIPLTVLWGLAAWTTTGPLEADLSEQAARTDVVQSNADASRDLALGNKALLEDTGKAEVNRSMELDELKKMKETVESAARDVEHSVQTAANEFEQDWAEATGQASAELEGSATVEPAAPVYRHPGKNWRLKRGAVPQWYKSRNGVRTKAQSGAARVARYRPQKFH